MEWMAICVATWSSVVLLDYTLRTCVPQLYTSLFVERLRLTVSLPQIRFVVLRSPCKVLRRLLARNSFASFLLEVWFTVGVISAICSTFWVICYLSKIFVTELNSNFYSFLSNDAIMEVHHHQQQREEKHLVERDEPNGLKFMIPGWNIPWAQVPLYIGTLLVVAVVHEMGHMLAASVTDVTVSSMGFVIFIIYFGAYVEMDTAALRRSSPLQKLRIRCAGIWHNLVLALFAWMLYEATPVIVSPLYISNVGVYVEDVLENSPLFGSLGLQKGNVIQAVNECSVSSTSDWNHCLKNLRNAAPGFCVPDEVIIENIANEMRLVENELDCCYNTYWNNSASYMCFCMRDWVRPTKGNQELLEYFSAKACACFSARYVAGLRSCRSAKECRISNSTLAESCVFPALLGNMLFMRISVLNGSRLVLYIGYVKELEINVRVSDYVPRSSLSPPLLPLIIELVAKYLFTFSFAFAVINSIPFVYLDGQYICSNFVDIIFSGWRPRRRRLLKQVILTYGTTLLVTNIILAIWKLYKYRL